MTGPRPKSHPTNSDLYLDVKKNRADRTAFLEPKPRLTRSLPWILRAVVAWAWLLVCAQPALTSAQSPPPPPAPAPTAPQSVPAFRQADNVAIITIHDEINKVTAESVERRIKQAAAEGANAIVFDLNTPGGEVGAVLRICTAIKQSPIPNTVAWVHPMAYSGGAIIALACREIIVSQPAALGDALPIGMSSTGAAKSLPDDLRKKILPPLLSEVTDSARRAGYDEYLVQTILIDGIQLWQIESVTEPGRRYCINADEYRLLFDADPPVGKPLLTTGRIEISRSSPPPLPADPAAPSVTPGSASGATPGTSEGPAQTPAPDAPTPSASKEFRPASERLSDIAQSTSTDLEIATRRPVFNADDKGKWKFVRYVTDGSGPIVMTAEEMRYFRFASATVRNEQELKAFLGAKNLAKLNQSWSESLVNVMTNPILRMALIVVFLLAMFIVMTHPGVIVPEVVALLALVALLAPPLLVGMANWWEIAAIIAGICMIFLEIFVIPGFGVMGIIGLLLLFGGLLGTFVPNGQGGLFPNTAEAQQDLLYGVASMLIAIVTSVAGMYYLSKHFGSLPVVSRLILKDPVPTDGQGDLLSAMNPYPEGDLRPGAEGVSVTPLRPAGRVQVGEKIIDVVAEMGYIPAGKRVRIVSADEFRIVVDLAIDPPSDLPEGESTA